MLRYEVDESYYPTYSSSDRKEAPFRGDIAYYGLGSFASSSTSGKEAARVPCGSISVAGTSGNNSNGSSGSGSGGGGSSTSTEGDNYTNISTPSYVYVAIDSAPSTTPKLTPSVEVGIGTWPETEHKADPKGAGEGPCAEAYKAPGGACKYLGSDCPEEELVFPINEAEDHVHLEDEVNNPCVKNILQKLQRKNMKKLTVPEIGGLDGTGHLSQGILDLFDGFDNLDLTFKIDEAGTNKNAFTETNVSGGNVGIFVTLDEEFVENGTQLAIARTIIHESVHAYLEYVTGNYSQSETAILLNEYRKQNDGSKNIAQHQFMSEFAEAIGASLSVWDNNSQSPEYYNYLAWSGDMTKSDTFKGLEANVQKAIVSANIAEGSAISGSTNNAKGKKCKD
ncbi:hypothetical protein Q4603_11920 [Zobellia galactanivorans]|uniref:hypothetical protein n=1 Tax=Zobellia galactanivorans (strain DSM 12802 / CCUG 47099 / CIP 106680 / NCIMB 13871 / Dsij) TaxID=63186 RepID=UPI0026E2732E|nr:hypothetical protein [Zobellia galactanivorans]MDO6809327.1 hypothetical protein [Zobellia galactanivorans]